MPETIPAPTETIFGTETGILTLPPLRLAIGEILESLIEGWIPRLEDAPRSFDQTRQALVEVLAFVDQRRDQQQEDTRDAEDEDDEDDRNRCRARHAAPLQPGHRRRERRGEHQRDHEGEQKAAKFVEQPEERQDQQDLADHPP
jgi:hypothetical protein